jgi:hypothetical protein
MYQNMSGNRRCIECHKEEDDRLNIFMNIAREYGAKYLRKI